MGCPKTSYEHPGTWEPMGRHGQLPMTPALQCSGCWQAVTGVLLSHHQEYADF